MFKRTAIVSSVLATLVIGFAGAANADSWKAATDGSSVKFENVGTDSFNVCDLTIDGYRAYVNWKFNGATGREEQAHDSTKCITFSHNWVAGKTVSFQSCEDEGGWWDDCSDWKSAVS